MDMIISTVILVLLCFIFYKEIKSDKPVDLFINFVISAVCIGTPLITYFMDGINFDYIPHIIYLFVMVVGVVFTIYYLIKYFRNKDNNNQNIEEEDNIDKEEA